MPKAIPTNPQSTSAAPITKQTIMSNGFTTISVHHACRRMVFVFDERGRR